MAQVTAVTGYRCSICGKEMALTTEGPLGGITKQIVLQKVIDIVMDKGGVATCSDCSPDGEDTYEVPQKAES